MSDRHDKTYDPKSLHAVDEFFDFLCGVKVEGITTSPSHTPKLTRKKAFTVIWFLQEHMGVFPDRYEMCDICERLYDSHSEGDCLDYGKAPYHFCGNCMSDWKYAAKAAKDPDDKG